MCNSKVSKVRAGLEVEIANSQKELQDLNAAAYSGKQGMRALRIGTYLTTTQTSCVCSSKSKTSNGS